MAFVRKQGSVLESEFSVKHKKWFLVSFLASLIAKKDSEYRKPLALHSLSCGLGRVSDMDT